jgi:hypothetical protein
MADTNQDTHEIRREIDGARADIQETIDALERRLSPSEVLDRVWSRVRDGGGAAVGGALRAHPVPAALLGTGLVWLALELARRDDHEPTSSFDQDERRHPSWELTGAAVYGDRRTYGTSDDCAAMVRAVSRERGRSLRSTIAERPLAIGAVALGLGLVAGLATPGTRWEDHLRQSRHEVTLD